MLRVLAAVIVRDGRFLVCQRRRDKRHGGLWEFPGGKVEAGESDLEAVRRELAEELGVEVVEVGRPIFTRLDPGTIFEIHFVPVAIEGEPAALEHEALAWLHPAGLLELPLAPADLEFALELVRRSGWGSPRNH